MKATNLNTPKGIKRPHRKENGFYGEYMILSVNDKGSIDKKISLRLYRSQATNTACIWISGAGEMLSGSGSAGGYGYNRMSAACEDAINNAGFKLSEQIGGVGESAVKEALYAIADTMGWNKPQFMESYA